MKKVVLVFPDTKALADFIYDHRPSNAEANTRECSLTGELSKDQIVIASSEYKAILMPYPGSSQLPLGFPLPKQR